MKISEMVYKDIEINLNRANEQQLLGLLELIEDKLVKLHQREEAEDKIYNAIYDYVEKYDALNISIARATDEVDNQLMIDKEDLKYLLVKHE